jgi:tricorn protease
MVSRSVLYNASENADTSSRNTSIQLMKIVIAILTVALHTALFAQTNPHWMRYCSISPDGKSIVFSYHGDLYRVSSHGGEAVALTNDESYDFRPVWSPDSKHIAYASDRYGNFDVFLIPATGGTPSRLTWHSADEYPYDFDNTGTNILFGAVRLDNASNRQFPSDALGELYEVPATGGRVTQLLTTPAEDAKMSSDGHFLIYHDRKARENPWRKHQTSSVTRDIWMYDIKNHTHRKITGSKFENRSPVFASSSHIYYLSEADGNFNIYHGSLKDTGNHQQVTFFKQHPVRFLSTAKDGSLCFGYDGDIYVKSKNGNPQKIAIVIAADKKLKDKKTIPIGDADEIAVSPNGMEVAFTFRGDVFVSSITGTNVKRITSTAGRERGINFSPDGRSILYASDRDNTWKIFQSSLERKDEPYFFNASAIRETLLIANEKENYQPEFSPDGKEIAYVENRNTIRIFNMLTHTTRTILGRDYLYSRNDVDQYFEWSPDNKWLLIKYSTINGNDEIGLISTSGKDTLVNLTRSGYTDDHPRWMMHGGMMIWNSDRNGLHSYANSSTRQTDVYAIFFDRRLWENFTRNKETMAAKEKDSSAPAKANPMDGGPWDWDGLTTRKEKLTAYPSLLSDALVSSDGKKLYYLSKFEKGYDLWQTDLYTHETKILAPLNADEATLQWDKTEGHIFILSKGKISRLDTGSGKREFISTAGTMSVDLSEERKNIFEYIWRRTKETFYTAGLHGIRWDEYKTSYEKYLSSINNNYDFSEMLNELLGELNVSHTGAEYNKENKDGDKTASLGIYYDESYQGDGVKILEVMEDGPLDNPFFGIRSGTIIGSVNGEPITTARDLAAWLNHLEGKSTLLSLKTETGIRKINVRPISLNEEWDLIYKRWVKHNEEETEKLSHGQLGYVHLYRMNDDAYRNTYDNVLGKFAGKKGIVVDTRFNRGGDLASELVMFLSGISTRKNTSDDFLVSKEPLFRWTKPSILLAGEANYSDGSCFAYDYKMLNMGKLVGMPIPGSCTWMTGQSLQDASLHFSVPALGVKTMDGSYMENVQLYPDIQVMNSFEMVSSGRDLQLELAIKELSAETQ